MTRLSERVADRDRATLGNKAFMLSRLCQDGFPVPPGLVIGTEVFDRFMEVNGIHHAGGSITERFQRLRGEVLQGSMPPELEAAIRRHFDALQTDVVAVRSSATLEDGGTRSFAGQFDSVLGATSGTLVTDIMTCWASLFKPRPTGDGTSQMEPGKMAVIVQEMVDADSSGVCFSVDPVSGDPGRIVIESVSGLGELLVQGLVAPDRYIVDKQTRVIGEKRISVQQQELRLNVSGGGLKMHLPRLSHREQKTDDVAIAAIAELAVRLEQTLRMAVDMEWAVKGQTLFLLQARPVTAGIPASHV